MRRSCSRATVFALAGILATSALAATRAYFVEPKAATSAWSAYQENKRDTGAVEKLASCKDGR
jgi:hypothetical protein